MSKSALRNASRDTAVTGRFPECTFSVHSIQLQFRKNFSFDFNNLKISTHPFG